MARVPLFSLPLSLLSMDLTAMSMMPSPPRLRMRMDGALPTARRWCGRWRTWCSPTREPPSASTGPTSPPYARSSPKLSVGLPCSPILFPLPLSSTLSIASSPVLKRMQACASWVWRPWDRCPCCFYPFVISTPARCRAPSLTPLLMQAFARADQRLVYRHWLLWHAARRPLLAPCRCKQPNAGISLRATMRSNQVRRQPQSAPTLLPLPGSRMTLGAASRNTLFPTAFFSWPGGSSHTPQAVPRSSRSCAARSFCKSRGVSLEKRKRWRRPTRSLARGPWCHAEEVVVISAVPCLLRKLLNSSPPTTHSLSSPSSSPWSW